jgi:hypothetical protein
VSNFLTRLATRALGGLPQVRPRLPSLFEAAPPLVDARGGLDEKVAELAPEPSASSLSARPLVPVPPVPPRRERSRLEREEPPGRGSPTVLQRLHPLTSFTEGQDKRAESPRVREGPRLRVGPSLAGRTEAPPALDGPASDAAPRAASGPDPSVFETEPRSVPARPMITPAPPREEGEQLPISPARATAPLRRQDPLWPEDRLAPLGIRAEGPRRGVGRSAAEPVVRVTIGRIEVRATAPAPPPAPAARPAGPRLSLEEYLRRRNEGRM